MSRPYAKLVFELELYANLLSFFEPRQVQKNVYVQGA